MVGELQGSGKTLGLGASGPMIDEARKKRPRLLRGRLTCTGGAKYKVAVYCASFSGGLVSTSNSGQLFFRDNP